MSPQNTAKTEGQVLLIGIMVMALLTTIVGTSALRSTTSTRSSKQVEESGKTTSVGVSILDTILGGSGGGAGSTAPNFSSVGQQQVNVQTTSQNTFITKDVVAKDGQYLFYISSYNPSTNTFSAGTAPPATIELYYGWDGAGNSCPVMEITKLTKFAESSPTTIASREYIGPCGSNGYSVTPKNNTIPTTTSTQVSYNNTQITFPKKTIITINEGIVALVIRPLYEKTYLGFSAGSTLPSQGRIITATVNSNDGAQSTQQVWQPYPQIPLDFFTTAF